MAFAIHFREEIDNQGVISELDDFYTRLNAFLAKAFNPDGTLKIASSSSAASVSPSAPPTIMEQVEDSEGHWWKNGPWIFDTDHSHDAVQITSNLSGTIHNFAYGDIDRAIGLELNLSADTTITGIKAPPQTLRRVLILRNNSSSHTITLKHQNTGSQPINRFALPGAADIVMGTLQTVWLYYDADNHRWGCFITANTAGGLAGAGGGSTGDVTGPGSSVAGNLPSFTDTTGKLLQDSGVAAPTSAPAATGNFTFLTTGVCVVDITGTQYKTLNSAPLNSGVGNCMVLGWALEENLDASVSPYSGSTTISLRFAGIAVDIVAGFATSNPPSGTRYVRWVGQGPSGQSLGNGVSAAGKNLQIRSSADLTGGSNLGNVQLRVHIYYAPIYALG